MYYEEFMRASMNVFCAHPSGKVLAGNLTDAEKGQKREANEGGRGDKRDENLQCVYLTNESINLFIMHLTMKVS